MKQRILAALLALAPFAFCLPVHADEPIQTQQYQTGQQVQASDLSGDIEAFRNLAGVLVNMILGSKSALPNSNPLQITTSASNMTVSIGGGGQSVIAQDVANSNVARVIDSCPQTSFTLASNGTASPRTDLLAIQYNQALSNPHVVPFSSGASSTVYSTTESCTYQYSTGTTTPPSGYVAFAQIIVPPGATHSNQAQVAYLFESVARLLTNQLGGIVSSLNGSTGAVQLLGSAGLAISQTSTGTYTISLTGITPGTLSIGNGAGGLSGTAFSANGSANIAASLGVGGGIAAGAAITAGNYNVPYSSEDQGHPTANIVHSNGGSENSGAGVSPGSEYIANLPAPYFTNGSSFGCGVVPTSVAGSTPTTGTISIQAYGTNSAGQVTSITFQNNTNATVGISFVCEGY